LKKLDFVCNTRYGDITPLSIPGKFLVMAMIIISLAFIRLAHPPLLRFAPQDPPLARSFGSL
jgi:hypothetical protein